MTHIYLIIAVAVLAASFAFGFKSGHGYVSAKWDKERAEMTARALEAERAARAEEQAKIAKAQEVANANARRAAQARADAAAARSELDGLRNVLAAAPNCPASNTTGAAGTDGADPARTVVAACAGELQIVAEAADAAEARVTALQAWISGVAR